MKALLKKLKIPFHELAPGKIKVELSLEEWSSFGADPFDLPDGWDWESNYILVKD